MTARIIRVKKCTPYGCPFYLNLYQYGMAGKRVKELKQWACTAPSSKNHDGSGKIRKSAAIPRFCPLEKER
jgi:hypothetical protein